MKRETLGHGGPGTGPLPAGCAEPQLLPLLYQDFPPQTLQAGAGSPEHGSPRGLGACPRLEGRAWRVTSGLLEACGEARPLGSAWWCQDSRGLAY